MDYRYDLFISYKSNPEFNPWVRNLLFKMIKGYLADIFVEPMIYIDYHTETGEDWVKKIGEALGSTRVMLALFTPTYFASLWCVHELDLMHQRLLNTMGNRLIIPAMASGDESCIPEEIGRLQIKSLKKYRILDLQPGTKVCQEFSEKIRELSDEIAKAINEAPPFDPKWESDCKERFASIYTAKREGLKVPVKSLTLKDPPSQRNVPRPQL